MSPPGRAPRPASVIALDFLKTELAPSPARWRATARTTIACTLGALLIVSLHIPQLDKCLFAQGNTYVVRAVGTIECHKLAAPKFAQLFADWEKAKLIDRVISCAGAFNPRLIRGSTTASRSHLSNHAWGTAIDLNDDQNPRKHVPVTLYARGCMRELVTIANSLGFFWGGHFRPFDGMHFELARL